MEIHIPPHRWYYTDHHRQRPGGLVFVHGAGADHTLWGYVARALQRHRVMAVDLPGHGRSTGPAYDEIGALAAALHAFLDRVLDQPAVLMGHSMGGAVALMTALTYPEAVARLGLIGTGARLRVHPHLLEMLERGDKRAAVAWVLEGAFASGVHPALVEKTRQVMLSCTLETLRRDFLACDRFDVMNRLEEIEHPALVVGMEEDRLTPLKYARYLLDHLPHAEMVTIPDSGHMVMLEQPVALIKAVDGWLKGAPAPATRGA